jgi:uncharacterized protein YbbK (DUF523 family)
MCDFAEAIVKQWRDDMNRRQTLGNLNSVDVSRCSLEAQPKHSMVNHDKESATIRVGISSCLLGESARFDGRHKRDAYITGTLSRWFEFVPLCPEVAIGLGIPREPIQMVARAGEQPRAVGVHTPTLDATEALLAFARMVAPGLSDICGYIFKSGSPSCGMQGVVIHSPTGAPVARGSGIFAQALMERYPLLPVEEESRLGDPLLRERFIERVFACHRHREQTLKNSG